jgi:hypothetical protein
VWESEFAYRPLLLTTCWKLEQLQSRERKLGESLVRENEMVVLPKRLHLDVACVILCAFAFSSTCAVSLPFPFLIYIPSLELKNGDHNGPYMTILIVDSHFQWGFGPSMASLATYTCGASFCKAGQSLG